MRCIESASLETASPSLVTFINPTDNRVRPTDSTLADSVRARLSPCGAPAHPPEWPRGGAGVDRGPPGVRTRSDVGGVGLDAVLVAGWAVHMVFSVDPGRHALFRTWLRLRGRFGGYI